MLLLNKTKTLPYELSLKGHWQVKTIVVFFLWNEWKRYLDFTLKIRNLGTQCLWSKKTIAERRIWSSCAIRASAVTSKIESSCYASFSYASEPSRPEVPCSPASPEQPPFLRAWRLSLWADDASVSSMKLFQGPFSDHLWNGVRSKRTRSGLLWVAWLATSLRFHVKSYPGRVTTEATVSDTKPNCFHRLTVWQFAFRSVRGRRAPKKDNFVWFPDSSIILSATCAERSGAAMISGGGEKAMRWHYSGLQFSVYLKEGPGRSAFAIPIKKLVLRITLLNILEMSLTKLYNFHNRLRHK